MNSRRMLPLVLLAAGSLTAQVSFSTTSLPTGVRPDEVVFGDVDLDGDLDLFVTVGAPTNGVEIWLNDGAGNFTFGQGLFVSAQSRTLVVEDLDGDGDLDLAVGTGASQVVVRGNLGNGTFGAGQSFAVGANPRGMTVADFDRDGRRDLAVANRDGNSVTVLRNTGGLTFVGTTLPTGTEPRSAAAADLNRDGLPDLVVANHDSRDVSVRLNVGGGAFGAETRLSVGAQFRAEWGTAADVDGDGDLDLVIALGEVFGQVGVFANNGSGAFGGMQLVAVGGNEPGTVLAMDANGDRLPDLLTANEDSNDVSVLLGVGAGGFVPAATVPTGLNPGGFAGGDLDGDGDLDFATASRDSDAVTVLRNTTAGAATNATMVAGGPAGVGVTTPLQLSSPPDAGMFYLTALSSASGPAIGLPDGRTLPLGPSDVLEFTLGNNPVLLDNFGMLDGTGHAYPRLALPNVPQLSGFAFYGTFIVFDAGNPLAIGTISDQMALQVP